jgi:DNA-binding NtrC family response regulator
MAALVGRTNDRISEKGDRQMRRKSQKSRVGSGDSFSRQTVQKTISISIVAARKRGASKESGISAKVQTKEALKMANRSIELGRVVIKQPDMARRRLMKALATNRGNVTHTSERLGIGRVTLRRWINRLELGEFVDELRETCREISRDAANC